MDILVRHQSDLYWTALLGALIVTLLWELRIPVRSTARDQRQRWSLNFTLLLVNQVVTFAAVPIASVSVAVKAAEAGWGLFNNFQLGSITTVVASMLAIDLAKYLQHYALHRVPILWRIHRTHHADPDCDVTTSFRFHPLEILVALLVEAAVIVLFGVPAAAVVLYQVARIALSTLAHGNVCMPSGIEAALRHVIVTPDLHRIHHSTDVHEQSGNLSGGLIWWDHLFGTYIASAALDQRTMPLGLAEYERSRANSLRAMLLDPVSAPK